VSKTILGREIPKEQAQKLLTAGKLISSTASFQNADDHSPHI
jgi:hypothetical protein